MVTGTPIEHLMLEVELSGQRGHTTTGATLPENNEASAELTTANNGTSTSSSARLTSQWTLQIARSVIDVL